MMGRSHILLPGASYAALAARPLDTPFGTLTATASAPVGIGPPPRTGAVSLVVATACSLAAITRSGKMQDPCHVGAPPGLSKRPSPDRNG
jgi:hypothetical protein